MSLCCGVMVTGNEVVSCVLSVEHHRNSPSFCSIRRVKARNCWSINVVFREILTHPLFVLGFFSEGISYFVLFCCKTQTAHFPKWKYFVTAIMSERY